MLADILCGSTCTFPVPPDLPREAKTGKYAESIWITMDDRKKAVSSSLFVLKIAFMGIILGDYLKIRKILPSHFHIFIRDLGTFLDR